MDDKLFWQELRAALLKQAHALQEQRAGILQQVAVIEKEMNMQDAERAIIQLSKRDSVTPPPVYGTPNG